MEIQSMRLDYDFMASTEKSLFDEEEWFCKLEKRFSKLTNGFRKVELVSELPKGPWLYPVDENSPLFYYPQIL